MTHFLAKIYFSLIRVLKSKKKKLALTFLLCLNQKNMIGCFMKTYFHQPIKILQFLLHGKIQKGLT